MIEMLDVNASGKWPYPDAETNKNVSHVIDVIHAIEYRTDNAVLCLADGQPITLKPYQRSWGQRMCPTIEPKISNSLMSVSISLMEMVSMF